MLFHITHTHSPTNCSAHKPERQAAFRKVMATATDHGITIQSAYINAPGHAVFLMVEAESALALAQVLDPVLEYGHYEVRPVVDAGEFTAAMIPGDES